MARHPIQPIENINGIDRFKENKIVRYLLNNGGIDLNAIARLDFDQDDRDQFHQLIGYSVSGAPLSSDTRDIVARMEMAGDDRDAELDALRAKLKAVRVGMVNGVAELFGNHPDDLMER